MLACFKIPLKVPIATSLCKGTTQPISLDSAYFFKITWLPFCLISVNPNLLSIFIISLPERIGNLGMSNLKSGNYRCI